jgi:NADH dehydrogenase
VHRAKALAARAVAEREIPTTTLATSLLYAPGDRRLARLERLGAAARGAAAGRGAPARSRCGPRTPPTAWSPRSTGRRDATSSRDPRCSPSARWSSSPCARAGTAAASSPCRSRCCDRCCGLRGSSGPAALLTWEEVLGLAVPMLSERGTADAEALGVRPQRMRDAYPRA